MWVGGVVEYSIAGNIARCGCPFSIGGVTMHRISVG